VITFWLVSAAMAAIALAFVLPPLWERSSKKKGRAGRDIGAANIAVYRDQLRELDSDLKNGIVSSEQYQQDKDDLERRLLEDVSSETERRGTKTSATQDRSVAYALALALPVLAVVLYLQLGNPNASSQAAATPPSTAGDFSQQRIEANVVALAKRLEQNPTDLDGWTMLARSYLSMEKYSEASNAYARVTELKSDDAELWADYAIAVAMAQGQTLAGRPAELIEKALQLDPKNLKALELAGNAAFEARDYRRAVEYWERLMKEVPANSEIGNSVSKKIDEAKMRAGNK
jgi:cytochrome c-type biogenesis protein CcmH